MELMKNTVHATTIMNHMLMVKHFPMKMAAIIGRPTDIGVAVYLRTVYSECVYFSLNVFTLTARVILAMWPAQRYSVVKVSLYICMLIVFSQCSCLYISQSLPCFFGPEVVIAKQNLDSDGDTRTRGHT